MCPTGVVEPQGLILEHEPPILVSLHVANVVLQVHVLHYDINNEGQYNLFALCTHTVATDLDRVGDILINQTLQTHFTGVPKKILKKRKNDELRYLKSFL